MNVTNQNNLNNFINTGWNEYKDDSTGTDISITLDVKDNRICYCVSIWDGEQYDSALNIGEYDLGEGTTNITSSLNDDEISKLFSLISTNYLNALHFKKISVADAHALSTNLSLNDLKN
ncbi:hypothetical protein [Bacillus cereus]|uniref:hypothetical protein n=1 Tax=Bacillus cereus TaxID=1396 RepID=UPI000B4C0BBE|nr:hypothetical protein [Bacillus cereus]